MTDTVTINGVAYRLLTFIDEAGHRTDDPKESCAMVVQDPSEARPQGDRQLYKTFKYPKGSLNLSILQ